MIASVSNPQVPATANRRFGERRGITRSQEDSGGVRQRGVMRSIEFMVRHQDEPMQVARLAAVANISLSHYFAVFKTLTGCTPMDYFTRLRMRRARKLLEDTPMSVKEVAAALGYDDPFYFSRVFKTFHDIAPSEYRLLPSRLRTNPGGQMAKLPNETTFTGSLAACGTAAGSPGEAVLTSTRRDYRIVESANHAGV